MNTASQPDNQNEIAIAEGLPLCKGDSADNKPIARKRFLIVDDSIEVRFSLRRMLRAAGAKEVDLADTGEAALEMMAQIDGGYDVVFLDYMMPGMSGIETLNEIKRRGIKNTEATRKIMLTGFYDAKMIEEAKSVGAALVLRKPCSLVSLNVAIS